MEFAPLSDGLLCGQITFSCINANLFCVPGAEGAGWVYLFIFKASVEAFPLASCLLVIRGVGRRLVSHELTVDKCSLP